jgi:hypothetical protein
MGDHHRGPTAVNAPVSSAQIINAAREAIRQLEPEELVMFDATAEAWLAGELQVRARHREPGAAVGFGIEAVLLSELVFPVITSALGQVLGTSITPVAERFRFGRHKPRQAAAGLAGGSPDGHGGETAALTAGQLRDVHDACQRDAAAIGLAPARATLLADAVVGALSGRPEAAEA